MSTMSSALGDSATMLRRDVRHMLRYPVMTLSGIGTPVIFMLLFVYVFGNSFGTLTGAPAGTGYVDYILPGLLLMAIGGGGSATAVNVVTDMTEGVITRFRTMSVPRAAVLAGYVAGNMLRTAASLAAVIAIGLLVGFRPNAGVGEWLAAAGILAAITFAVSWLAVAIGLVTSGPAGANSASLILQFGAFISSAFVPTTTMSTGVAWFARNQPFTPIIDTVRGLLLGGPVGHSAPLALAWSAGLALVGFAWALAAFRRQTVR